MTRSIYSVALDSDGVLADFDRRAIELLGGRRIHEVPKGTLWASIERYNNDVQPFFETLELMDGAETLVQEHFVNPFVLTATGYTPKDGNLQKQRWYAKRFPTLSCVCVAKSPDKAAYATPTTILVDDRRKSLDPWIAAGGIGILHTSVEDTIEQLRAYL